MTGQTDKMIGTRPAGGVGSRDPEGLTEGARLGGYAAVAHHKLSGASIPWVAQYLASR